MAWARSGLVHRIAYIKQPTAFANGIFDIASASASVVGHCFALRLKCEANGVDTGLAFMLNFSSTLLMYLPWERYNLPLSLSLRISIPKIFLATPRSFMSNSEF